MILRSNVKTRKVLLKRKVDFWSFVPVLTVRCPLNLIRFSHPINSLHSSREEGILLVMERDFRHSKIESTKKCNDQSFSSYEKLDLLGKYMRL